MVHTAEKDLCNAARLFMIGARVKLLLRYWLNSLVVMVLKSYSVAIKQVIILIIFFKNELKWENCLGKCGQYIVLLCEQLRECIGVCVFMSVTHIHRYPNILPLSSFLKLPYFTLCM